MSAGRVDEWLFLKSISLPMYSLERKQWTDSMKESHEGWTLTVGIKPEGEAGSRNHKHKSRQMCAPSSPHILQLLLSSCLAWLQSAQLALASQSAHSPLAVSLTLMLIPAGFCSTLCPAATHLSAGNQLALCTLCLPWLPPPPPLQLAVRALRTHRVAQ